VDRSLHDGLLPTLEKIKKLGYDGVEIPLFDLSLDYAAWGRKLDDLGLERTAVTVRGGADNPISADAKIRAAGVAASKKTLDCCQAGRRAIVGRPYHSASASFPAKVDGRRMEMGRREHAAGGGACWEGRRRAGGRVSQSVRVLFVEHRGRFGAI